MKQDSVTTDTIKDSIDPQTILNYYGFKHIRNFGDTLRACCAIHGGDNDTGFVWNLENNLWFCYTGDCGGGDVYDLIMKMEGVDFKTAVYKAAEIAGINIDGLTFHQRLDVVNEQRKWLEKQKKKYLYSNSEYINTLPHKKYSVNEIEENDISTRFKPETFTYYDSYFTKLYPTEFSCFTDKLIIPISKNNIICGVAMRDFTGVNKPKWLYQPKGIKTTNLLYNYDDAMKIIEEHSLNELILVEGIFDVWAYHEAGIDNVVCVFGSNISDSQSKMILRAGVNVVLSFDNDEAGNKCTNKAIKIFKNKTDLKKIYLPTGCDPCDLDRDVLRTLYLNRQKL